MLASRSDQWNGLGLLKVMSQEVVSLPELGKKAIGVASGGLKPNQATKEDPADGRSESAITGDVAVPRPCHPAVAAVYLPDVR